MTTAGPGEPGERGDVLDALERMELFGFTNVIPVPPWTKETELRADAALLRELREALAGQPIMWCSEKENPVSDWNRGTVRVCGWCSGCCLDALLRGEKLA